MRCQYLTRHSSNPQSNGKELTRNEVVTQFLSGNDAHKAFKNGKSE